MSVTLVLIPVAIAVAGAISTRKERSEEIPNSFGIETRMRDEELLEAALNNYGCKSVTTTGETIGLTLDGTRILFECNEQGVFEAVFVGDISADHARSFVTELNEEYTQLVQQQVYENLLARAKQRGLVMESEEVQEDNSIVLTFRV